MSVTKEVYDPSRRHGYECLGDICITLESFMGTGGGNVPLVVEYQYGDPIQQSEE